MFSICWLLKLIVFLLLQYETYSMLVVKEYGTLIQLELFQEEKLRTEDSISVWKAFGKIPESLPVQIAIALEGKEYILEHEWKIYHKLGAITRLGDSSVTKATEAGICRVFFKGLVVSDDPVINGKLALVTELLGENLMTYSEGRNLGALEWMRISHGMMTSIAYLHTLGIRHGDITPEKFRLALTDTYDSHGRRNTKVYLSGIRTAQVEPWQIPQRGFCANTHFCSKQTHHLIQMSAKTPISKINESYKKYDQDLKGKDDMEPLAFSIYFIKYGLPWFPKLDFSNTPPAAEGNEAKYENLTMDEVAQMKEQFPKTIAETFQVGDGKISRTGAILGAMLKYARFVNLGGQTKPEAKEKHILRGLETVVDELCLAANKQLERARLRSRAMRARAVDGTSQNSDKKAPRGAATAKEESSPSSLQIDIASNNTSLDPVEGNDLKNRQLKNSDECLESNRTDTEEKTQNGKNLESEDKAKEEENLEIKNEEGASAKELANVLETPIAEIENHSQTPVDLTVENKFEGNRVTCKNDGYDNNVTCVSESEVVNLVVPSNVKKQDKTSARSCICVPFFGTK